MASRNKKFDKQSGSDAAIMDRITRMMAEEERRLDEPGATLIFHFDNYDEATKVWQRVEQMGGLSTNCEGHFFDDADLPGFVVADVMHDLIIDTELHPDEWSAMDVMEKWVDDESILPQVYAVVPLNLIASDRCAGYAAQEESSE